MHPYGKLPGDREPRRARREAAAGGGGAGGALGLWAMWISSSARPCVGVKVDSILAFYKAKIHFAMYGVGVRVVCGDVRSI